MIYFYSLPKELGIKENLYFLFYGIYILLCLILILFITLNIIKYMKLNKDNKLININISRILLEILKNNNKS